MADKKEKLFSDFPEVSTQEWMDKIQTDLKGADYEKKLVWKTNEGFKVKPFYRQEDIEGLKTLDALPGEFPYVRGNKKNDNTWYIRQNIRVENPEEANRKALDLLNKGIDSLGFHLKGKDVSRELLDTLLKDIHCDCIELNFTTCQRHTVELAQLLAAYFKEKGYDPKNIYGSVNFDPISKMLQKGKDVSPIIGLASEVVNALAEWPHFRCIGVDALRLNNSGAYIYQELGYALAWGNEYLNRLIDTGVPVDLAAGKIKFNFGISSNYFMEIAKFRAARMLWADIVKAYQPEEDNACQMHVHAITSTFNMTLFDSYVNLLRSQTEAMSAAIAGVDSMTVTPFDSVYETPNEFSERLARNQQLLLKEESHFNRIVDPAGGSYYIENLTVSIAKEAWNLFLQTEDEGGMVKAIQNESVQNAVNQSNKARHEAVSRRKEILLGTNQYPNFTELAGGKAPLEHVCGCGGKEHHHDEEASFAKLDIARAASEFEALRLETEHSGKRPKAFMLTIGNLAMRQARAQFSCNFLACAGYEVIDNLGFASVEEGIEAALKAQADIVVLCSSDDEYAQYAIPAYQALAGRAMFIVAGAPACMEELKAAGIENFIHVRCNVLETLREFNKQLLVK
ncbi:methylmalonyl-CoA mutase small subunit [Phocaeicola salanitronis]|uniref:methylmalonyl-CoA mutase small subunit n=1 Tax=Phocaeicola salanitronis TaxID=376805 RepID=UPI0025A451D1|nr:methylmalonyl-CoA mutase small subunit [Phocaeicola salanitronis]MDM8305994.1 methylmalonyl-CoA mutase small subunit [Phocaeicola salanitronis]